MYRVVFGVPTGRIRSDSVLNQVVMPSVPTNPALTVIGDPKSVQPLVLDLRYFRLTEPIRINTENDSRFSILFSMSNAPQPKKRV